MTITLRRSPQVTATSDDVDQGTPPSHRLQLLSLLLLALWLVASGGFLGSACFRAANGGREMGMARRSLGATEMVEGRISDHLDRARQEFAGAARAANSPLLAPMRVVPVLGRQVRSFADLTTAAERIAAVGVATVDNARTAVARTPVTGPERVALVRDLDTIASRAEAQLGAISVRPRRGLFPALTRRWTELDGSLTESRASLHRTGEVLNGVADLLQGPRRFLVLAANNSEMRAGSGMFLSAAILDVARGSLALGPMRPTGELALGGTGVGIDGDLAARWGWLEPGREWRNLATTPRFDATAPVASRMWERLTGERVDGVLALDVELLRALLVVVGPVTVDGRVVTAATAVQQILHDQYFGVDFDDAQGARREQLGRIAAATLAAVEGRTYSLAALAGQIAAASRGRHFLAWSAAPEEQRIWHAAGVDGSLTPSSLALNVLNRGGNKLDQFLAVTATLDVRATPETTELALQITMLNRTPPGEAHYVAGPHPESGLDEGEYAGILAVNLPGTAFDIGVQGTGRLVAAGSDGPTQVVAAPVLLPRGETASIVVRFRLPPSHRSVTVIPSGRMPPVVWEVGAGQWDDTSPRVLRWQ